MTGETEKLPVITGHRLLFVALSLNVSKRNWSQFEIYPTKKHQVQDVKLIKNLVSNIILMIYQIE